MATGAEHGCGDRPSRSCQKPSGKTAVLLWNHDFGWSWGVEESDVRRTISIVDTLGIGRTPDPLRCADRVIELISAQTVCSRMCSEH